MQFKRLFNEIIKIRLTFFFFTIKYNTYDENNENSFVNHCLPYTSFFKINLKNSS